MRSRLIRDVAEVVLFHHAQGRTAGCAAFADELRAAGHVVHVPDLYDGKVFDELADGIAYAREIGFEAILDRGRRAAASLPSDVVYAGFSLGVMPAQMLAQTRPGAKGAILMHGCVPPSEFGGTWPAGLPLQIHTMSEDPLGDADVARDVATSVEGSQVFLYPGDRHLFADASLRDHDAAAAALLRERVLAFLATIER